LPRITLSTPTQFQQITKKVSANDKTLPFPPPAAVFMPTSSLLAEQCVTLRAARHRGQREDTHTRAPSLSHRENGQVVDTDVILEAPFFFSFLFFPPICKRCLSFRNPDTAHRDQNVAFFSGFLQGCCLGLESIMQMT